ncbi:MAG: segregation/condensation protein A [Candidatus Aureabacteria bacterium]|nr:segregation/condensation protein A [Candidatus Auribacterota bacterium]
MTGNDHVAPPEGEEIVPGGGESGPKASAPEAAAAPPSPADQHARAMEDMRDCKVSLDMFEGPLDLLLYLIRREEVEIFAIPIVKITDQYIRYLDLMRMLDLDIASEFLVMAATLLHIKSRMLLPPEERPVEEQIEEEEDPRMALVRQLLEYKKFKEAAGFLSGREIEQHNIFPRYVDRTFLPEPTDSPLTEVSIFDLIGAFSEVLKRVTGEPREISEEIYTVAEKIAAIVEILKTRSAIRFSELFKDSLIRAEVVVTFLALLELIRLKKIQAHQPSAFAEIEICAA